MKQFSPERLASKRRRRGMTQMRLSQAAGISQVSICALEKGKKSPSARTLAKLADALDCTMDFLFA